MTGAPSGTSAHGPSSGSARRSSNASTGTPSGTSTGLEIARRFYAEAVRPLLGAQPHAAALLGNGSEILGFDDDVSTDHDFGPRVQIFLPDDAALAAVPAQLPPAATVDTVERFFVAWLGVDPAGDPTVDPARGPSVGPARGMRLADWLLTPTQVLASLTAGAVFHDPYPGLLARRRAALQWYPHDIWRYALAAAWLRLSQEEAFAGRAGSTGDDLGSRVVAGRLVRDLMRLTFLIERHWAPYSKWLGRAFADLRLASRVGPALRAAMATSDWREREAAVCSAGEILGAATNELRLAEPVDPAPRQFYARDIRVVGGDRFTVALTAAITDDEVVALLDRLGHRAGGGAGATVGMLPGTIDQAVDSTDVLCHPARCRAAAGMLGL